MKIEIMNESHRDKVLELSKAFYCSDALDHEVPMNIIETNIDAAISGDKGLIGFVFCEDNEVVGFSYVTTYYETEVGGICVQIIDLYVNEMLVEKVWRHSILIIYSTNTVVQSVSDLKSLKIM